MKKSIALCILATALGCSHPKYAAKDLNEQLVMATLWVQTSAEYRALCYQAYNVAKTALDQDLKEVKTPKKRAVIVDGDETTIQANEYEAYLIGKDLEYPTGWFDWVGTTGGPPIYGALEFLNYAASKGVETFYVTNRKVDLEDKGTFDNLKKYNFPYVDKEHLIFRAKGQVDDKADRQMEIEKKYHVVLYVGDNMDDFPGGFWEKNVEQRAAAAEANRETYGKRFIVLPNPMYGTWERALKDYKKGLSAEEQDRLRKSSLRMWKK